MAEIDVVKCLITHVILLQNDKGGAGKTTVTDYLTAALTLGGKRVRVLDADAGNHSFMRRCGPGSAVSVGWHLDAAAAEDFVQDHLLDVDVVLIDFGANLQASAATILAFINELLWLLMRRGAAIVRVGVASPNASGTAALMRDLVAQAAGQGEVVIIENNADGSSSFASGLANIEAPRATMMHVPPGIVAIRLRRVEPLASILIAPSPRYVLATAVMARAVHELASQPPFALIVGPAGLERLAELAHSAPHRLCYTTTTPRLARDDVLSANEKVCIAMRTLMVCDAGAALPAVTAWREAKAQYDAAAIDAS